MTALKTLAGTAGFVFFMAGIGGFISIWGA